MRINCLFELVLLVLLNDTDKTLATIPNDFILLWENGIVYYTIDEDDFEEQEQVDAILEGMKMIEDATRLNGKDCIKFQERDSEDRYLYIISGDGCYSFVGKFAGSGPQELSLGAGGCTWAAIVAHEFIHALGFEHEQNRPDRDEFITIMWDNVNKDDLDIFDKYIEDVDTLGLTYDFESIMHYSPYAGAIDDSKPTMVPKNPKDKIQENEKLSKLDIESIRKLYGCI